MNVLTLTIIPGQTLSATVDNGQMVALDCSMTFNDQEFPLYLYRWYGKGNKLSTMARYVVTADSDSSYMCLAFTIINLRLYGEHGFIDITVRGTYSSSCSIAEQPLIKY